MFVNLISVLLTALLSSAEALIPCGRSVHRGGKIVGGEKATHGEFPWQVQLRRNNFQICGGSILSENFIVTAAHCVQNTPSLYTIGYGSLEKYVGASVVRVRSVHIHPDWNPRTGLSNDIALLQLETPIVMDRTKAAPICLPPNGYGYTPTDSPNLKVSGWGRTTEGGSTSQSLMFTTVPIIDDSKCTQRYAPVFNNTSMFCAMFPTGGRDSCQGDSGGPAVVNHNGVHYLAGVVSWGEGCARYGAPGVYTRVSTFNPWIEQVLAQQGFTQDVEQVRSTLNSQIAPESKTEKVREPYITTTSLMGLIPDLQSNLPSNPLPVISETFTNYTSYSK